MAIEVVWRTRPGDRTPENRDFAGVGVRDGAVFCILLDGSTRGRGSGDLVREIGRGMVDAFVEGDREEAAEDLIGRLHDLHARLARRWPQATASYLMVRVHEARPALVLHAGDCLLGHSKPGGGLTWLTRPDTLADVFGVKQVADIINDPSRHRVTRSFRMREFMPPSALQVNVESDLILATDGFWADLSDAEQARFLAGEDLPPGENVDDRSVLRLRIHAGSPGLILPETGGEAGIHVRIAGIAVRA